MTPGAARMVAIAALAAGACSDPPSRPDAGPPPDSDARVYPDGGPGTTCRGAYCGAGEACCHEALPQPITYCLPEPSLCEGTAFTCDGPEDCAETQECCTGADGTACVDEGTCAGYIACHGPDDCQIGVCCPTPIGVIDACLPGCARSARSFRLRP